MNFLKLFVIIVISCKATIFFVIDEQCIELLDNTYTTQEEIESDIIEDINKDNKSVDILLEKFEAKEVKK